MQRGHGPGPCGPAPVPAARLALLGVLLLSLVLPGGAHGAKSPFTAAGTAELDARIDAVAINADESVLAAAGKGKGGAARVAVYDRRSMNLLGALQTDVVGAPHLTYSPAADLLLVWSPQAAELWEVPIAPLRPDGMLDAKFRRWHVDVEGAPALAQAGFGEPPQKVYWIRGGDIYARSINPKDPVAAAPVFASDAGAAPFKGFAPAPGGGPLAAFRHGEKTISLIRAGKGGLPTALDAHRFALSALAYHHGGTLLSMDSANTLIRWQDTDEPAKITYVKELPQGFETASIEGLTPPFWLLIGARPEGVLPVLVNADNGATSKVDVGQDATALATSPTGKYVLFGKGKTLALFQFAFSEAPGNYVRRLHKRGAFVMARHYADQLDSAGVSALDKSMLEAELKRLPASGPALDDLLERLAAAEANADPEGMRYWADKVLEVSPNHPQAQAALERILVVQEQKTLQAAREAMEHGENLSAINLLSSRIGANSPNYDAAQTIIREAEARRRSQTALDQAREKMNLNNFPAARAIVREVLRQEPANQTARELLTEIEDRAAGPLGGVAARIGIVLLLVAVLVVAYRTRARWMGRLASAFPDATAGTHREEPRPAGPAPGGRAAAGAPPGTPSGASRRMPGPTPGASPRPGRDRRSELEALLDKTEEMVRLLRQWDTQNQHTTVLLEFEAELHSLHRRVRDGSADFRALEARLIQMQSQLRRLQFHRKTEREQAHDEAEAEPSFYELLQVPPDASPEAIRNAYHRRLKEYHPDLHSNSGFDWIKSEAERMSKRIGEAYEVLKDQARREAYDRELRRKRRSSS